MREIIRILIITICFLHHFGYSENVDTLKLFKSKTVFFNSEQFENSDSVNFIENSLDNFQNYLSHEHLGNSGMPINDIRHSISNGFSFCYHKNYLKSYFFSKKSLLFYDTKTPYSDLFYIVGSQKEQSFKVAFSYNVKKNWNVTANFYRIRSEGYYLRQNTNDNFISLSSIYKSKNNRYNLLFGIMYNYVQNAENGGILNDSIFENGVNLDKKLLDVNLTSARSSYLNRSVFVNQYVNFGVSSRDSLKKGVVVPLSRLLFSTVFDDNLIKYEDDIPQPDFYSNIYYDSTKTYDSTYNLKFENELSWKRLDNKKHRGLLDKFGFGLRAKNQFVYIKQREIDTTFNNIIFGLDFFNTYSDNQFWYMMSGQYVASGYNNGDYSIDGSFKKGLKDSLAFLTFLVSSKLQMPDYVYSRYSSNHFKWDNDLKKTGENSLGINFSFKKYRFSVGCDYKHIANPVYFDNYAIARQYEGVIPVVSAYLKKNFTFYNWHLNNSILYQSVPDSTVIRLPEYILEHSLYYENDLFKEAMRLQIGASVYYVSNYFSNKYMPANGQFYLQDDKKYGNYPFIDLFLNVKVKSVRVFFKVDHLNSGWMGNKYQMTPSYPINDRAFKLGISWRFYD